MNANKFLTNKTSIPNPMFFNPDGSIRSDIDKDLIRNSNGDVVGVRTFDETGSVTQAAFNLQTYADIKIQKILYPERFK
jgi:hypothetical protein